MIIMTGTMFYFVYFKPFPGSPQNAVKSSKHKTDQSMSSVSIRYGEHSGKNLGLNEWEVCRN